MGAHANGIPLDLGGGRLEGLSFPELLWGLCRAGATGVLELQHDGWRKRIFIEKGRVVFAASSNPDDRLGETLLREEWITLEQLERAVERLGSGRRLGTLLVEQGAITPHDLVQAVVMQVKRIVLDLFVAEEGAYRFHEGPLPNDELITLGMRTGDLLLEGMRRIRSFTRMRRAVGPPGTRYRLSKNWSASLEGLELSAGERSLLQQLDARGRSVEELCREALLSNFETYQTLWAFRILGVVEEVAPDPAHAGSLRQGSLGPEGILPVLIDLCRKHEEGVLYLSRGQRERALYLRDGRCLFARSGSLDDGLVAHLLRRGVISLEDREEVGKRLLSNKRVGQILQDMGVLTHEELVDVVREQLREIILDCLQWSEGVYAFVAEPLPTREEIVLDWSLEDLVLAGIRRVTSWRRVAQGCGLGEGPLALTPSYLEVLDRMQIGDEEWRIVAALREPAEVREICRSRGLPAFRVCQVLWALRLLGAVAPAAEVAAGVLGSPLVEARPAADGAPAWSGEVAAGSSGMALPRGEAIEPADPGAEGEFEVASAEREIEPPAAPSGAEGPAEASRRETQVLPCECAEAASAPEEPSAVGAAERREGAAADLREIEAAPSRDGPEGQSAYHSREEAWPQARATPIEDRALREAVCGREERSEDDLSAAVRTTRLRPEEIEAALATGPAGPEPEARSPGGSGASPPEAPADLEPLIERFNEMQRVLFRSIRAEIGAGAFNFVRSCGGRVEGTLFARVGLGPDGAWDPQGLKQALLEAGVPQPWTCFERLIEEELRRLEVHLGQARVAGLRERLLDRSLS